MSTEQDSIFPNIHSLLFLVEVSLPQKNRSTHNKGLKLPWGKTEAWWNLPSTCSNSHNFPVPSPSIPNTFLPRKPTCQGQHKAGARHQALRGKQLLSQPVSGSQTVCTGGFTEERSWPSWFFFPVPHRDLTECLAQRAPVILKSLNSSPSETHAP